jgi:hypothetical protein
VRAPETAFADAIAVLRQRYDPAHNNQFFSQFFARMRHCTYLPPPRTANDYVELAGSLYVAWCVVSLWSWRPGEDRQLQQAAVRKLTAIELVVNGLGVGLDPLATQYLMNCARVYAAYAHDPLRFLYASWTDLPGLPKRRDQLTFADLGRERRRAGSLLFVREASAAMRSIFGKPHDKIVGELAGLAFETAPLAPETVRTMRRKTGLTRPE